MTRPVFCTVNSVCPQFGIQRGGGCGNQNSSGRLACSKDNHGYKYVPIAANLLLPWSQLSVRANRLFWFERANRIFRYPLECPFRYRQVVSVSFIGLGEEVRRSSLQLVTPCSDGEHQSPRPVMKITGIGVWGGQLIESDSTCVHSKSRHILKSRSSEARTPRNESWRRSRGEVLS